MVSEIEREQRYEDYLNKQDRWNGLLQVLERIAEALEHIVLNMEKPVLTRQDHQDYMETRG